MDWAEFFERTRVAAGVESFSKLAPMLEITDGAIGHYRMGRRVPQVWVVAAALKIQGHPTPEKAAIDIMKKAALTSPERAFWKRLGTAAMAVLCAIGFSLPMAGNAHAAGISHDRDSQVFQPNAYYVTEGSGGLGLVGPAPALVAGMEAAWDQVRADREL